ncbi:hypothetical protein CVT26_006352 [Gymnopilus dilepis]|uniref:Uncharacterized protein n=1 Tax=Gymnopilus dilepis TaxID=231916 RepID=A0A409W647_9AGAR|nr:hypothetical protein CVT26_006352 [Gymnopilus dilepis]
MNTACDNISFALNDYSHTQAIDAAHHGPKMSVRRGRTVSSASLSCSTDIRKRSQHVRRRSGSQVSQPTRGIESSGSTLGAGAGVALWDNAIRSTFHPKKPRVIRKAAREVKEAMGRIQALSFKELTMNGKERSKLEERTCLLNSRDMGEASPFERTSGLGTGMEKISSSLIVNTALPGADHHSNNPFATPPPSPSTERSRRESVPVPLSELTNDPTFWRKKLAHGRVKMGRLLGEKAGVAEYEKMIDAHLSQIDRSTNTE